MFRGRRAALLRSDFADLVHRVNAETLSQIEVVADARRPLLAYAAVVLEHLIKWRYQRQKRSTSWSDSIEEHRDRILRILEDSPSLTALPGEILEQEYRRARRKALRDTGLDPDRVPTACPFTAGEALDADYWPEG